MSGREEPAPPPAPGPPVASGRTVEEVIRHRLGVALGGWRGSVETALPMLAFVGVWTWRHDLRAAAVGAVVVALVLAGLRLAQRSGLQHVGGAVLATGIAAVFALRSGRAEDAFLPGILFNVFFAAVSVISLLSRWPLVGFVVGAGDPRAKEDPFAWRRDPGLVRVCARLTWVLLGVYAVRVLVMYPLYAAGQVAALGVAKLALGWPLWALAVVVMGWLLLRGRTPLDPGPTPAPDELA